MIKADSEEVRQRLKAIVPKLSEKQVELVLGVLNDELSLQDRRFRMALNMVRTMSMGIGIKQIRTIRRGINAQKPD